MIFSKAKKFLSSQTNSGFAMLFAVLLSSVLISIGLSIFNISLKEVNIATSAADSESAYYAADSARECAIYWDIVQGAMPACIGVDGNGSCIQNTLSTSSITCAGHTITVGTNNSNNLYFTLGGPSNLTYSSQGSQGSVMQNFFVFPGTLTSPAADISITKTLVTSPSDPTNQYVNTIIETYGHNSQIPGRRVERGMSFSYTQ